MGKDYIEIIPRQVKDAELASDAIDHTAIADSFITVNSGDPAASNDTGEGYVLGSLWVNTTSGEQFICTNVTAEDAVWINQEGDSINLTQFTSGSSNGFLMGGNGPGGHSDTIWRLDLTSDSSAVDTTDELTNVKYSNAGAKSSTNIHSCGDYGPAPGPNTAIDSYTISSPHTYTDWGEITVSTGSTATSSSHNNSSYAWVIGGYPTGNDTIQKYATASPSDTTDVGEYPVGIRNQTGVTDTIGGYGYCFSGDNPSPGPTAEIARFSLTSDGNAADVGDLTQAIGHTSGAPDISYAFVVEGVDPSAVDIDRLAWTSSGNSTDVGEVSRVQNSGKQYSSIHNSTHWYQVAGYTHPATAYVDTIDKISYTSPHPLTDVGEIADNTGDQAAASV